MEIVARVGRNKHYAGSGEPFLTIEGGLSGYWDGGICVGWMVDNEMGVLKIEREMREEASKG